MIQKIKQPIQNGIVAIADMDGGVPPEATEGNVWATPSCILVVTLHEIDGEAEIILAPANEVRPSFEIAFDGVIETPHRKVEITTVMNEPLLAASVPDAFTRIRIWLSHPKWPEQVIVGWG